MFQSPSRLQDVACLWVFALLCLIVLFANLGSAALFEPDEGRNAEVGREILLLKDWVTPHYNFIPRLDKPIFFYWLVAWSQKLFGLSEWSARLPSVLFGLAGVFLVYRLARTLLGPWEGLWSGLILVTSFEYFILSRTVILDMTLTFFITLSLGAFWWARHADRSGTKKTFYLLMYGAMGCATLVKGPIGVLLPGMVIFVYLLVGKKWSILREMELPLGAAIFFLVATPWYLWAEWRNPGYLRYFFLHENILRFSSDYFEQGKPWYYFFLVLAIGLLPWTFLIPSVVKDLWKGPPDDKRLFLILWAVLPFLFFSLSQAKMAQYMLPVYPPISILAGAALAGIFKEPGGKKGWLLSLPLITLIVLLLTFVLLRLGPSVFALPLPDPVYHVSQAIPFWLPAILLSLSIIVVLTLWTNLGSKRARFYLVSCASCALFFFFLHHVIAAVSGIRSSKELAEKSAALIRAEDQIAVYDTYLSSLPFYLGAQKPIWAVWSGKKSGILGSHYVAVKKPPPAPGYGKVLVTFEEFSQARKESNGRVLVFVKEKNLSHLSERFGVMPKRLLQVDEIVLVTNR